MKRRKWLQTVLSAPAIAALPAAAAPQMKDDTAVKLELGSPDTVADRGRQFFTDSEYAALTDLCKQVFPSIDGRPGAIEAKVPEFLDFLISQSPKDRQMLYRNGLANRNAAFLAEAKDDILRATFNSREWNQREGARRGGGSGTYYLPAE